jgi:DNA-binding transcriptional LysR family regulator
MNLETLHLYCDVVRSNSFSLGAAANSVSQPAASQAIRQLEQDLGTQLIDRTKRPFAVTREGSIFFEACQEIVERFERARAEIDTRRARVEGSVRVAVIYSVGLENMGWYTERFTNLHTRARIRLAYLHPDEVVDAVLSDRADLGILSFPTPHRSLTTIPWRSEPMVLVSPPDHPVANLTTASAADVGGHPFVAFDRTLAIRRAIDRALRKDGVRANVTMHFDNIETIKQAITTQSCVSILPQPSVRREVEEGILREIPLEMPGLVRPVGIIYRRNRELSPTTESLLDFLQEYRPGDVVT